MKHTLNNKDISVIHRIYELTQYGIKTSSECRKIVFGSE